MNNPFNTTLPSIRRNPKKPVRKLLVGILKGGGAKTTTSVHVAHGLALAGRKVLLIDFDPFGGCSAMLGLQGAAKYNASHLLSLNSTPMKASDVILKQTHRHNLHLIDKSDELVTIERGLAKILGKMEDGIAVDFSFPQYISDRLKEVENEYDYIVIDTPPSTSLMTMSLHFFAPEIILPIYLQPLAVNGTMEYFNVLMKLVLMQKSMKAPTVHLKYAIPSAAQTNTLLTKTTLEGLDNYFNGPAKNYPFIDKHTRILHPVRYSIRVAELANFGQTIFEHDPYSDPGRDYQKIIEEIIKDE